MPARRARRAGAPQPDVARGRRPQVGRRRPWVLVPALVCLAATAAWQPRVAAVLAAVASVLSATAALRRLLAGYAGADEPTADAATPRTVRVEVGVPRPGGDGPADVVPVTVQVELPTPREPVHVAEDAQPP